MNLSSTAVNVWLCEKVVSICFLTKCVHVLTLSSHLSLFFPRYFKDGAEVKGATEWVRYSKAIKLAEHVERKCDDSHCAHVRLMAEEETRKEEEEKAREGGSVLTASKSGATSNRLQRHVSKQAVALSVGKATALLNKADDAALVVPPLANGLAPMNTNMMSPIGEEAKDASGFVYSGGIGNFKVDPSAVMKSRTLVRYQSDKPEFPNRLVMTLQTQHLLDLHTVEAAKKMMGENGLKVGMVDEDKGSGKIWLYFSDDAAQREAATYVKATKAKSLQEHVERACEDDPYCCEIRAMAEDETRREEEAAARNGGSVAEAPMAPGAPGAGRRKNKRVSITAVSTSIARAMAKAAQVDLAAMAPVAEDEEEGEEAIPGPPSTPRPSSVAMPGPPSALPPPPSGGVPPPSSLPPPPGPSPPAAPETFVVNYKAGSVGGPLGLGILGVEAPDHSPKGLFVSSVKPNGQSMKDGRIKAGDRLMMVGDIDIANVSSIGAESEDVM